ncbi:MAG: FtsX-like permease family protein [Bacteroidales bacterium]|jgi:putative ABC transport system permease protein|nr:FtsX-like permease family protein [Bacteroidales bacterium]
MLKHLFKIIWTERKVNAWILVELILAFAILWFCCDYLLYSTQKLLEPKGFNTEHTYIIDIWNEDEGLFEDIDYEEMEEEEFNVGYTNARTIVSNWSDAIWEIYDRIKRHPAVEHASLSLYATPYAGSYAGNTFWFDSISFGAQIKKVTPEFFDVYQIDILKGRKFNETDDITENNIIISGAQDNIYKKINFLQIDTLLSYRKESKYNVIGVAEPTKRLEFENYTPAVYLYLSKSDEQLIGELSSFFREFSVRVKPEADKNFAESFLNDMQSQLEIEPFFLASVIPLKDRRSEYMQIGEYSNGFKSIYSISAFLIINIVLCVMGTFWLRIQSRRSNIGLRMALGASKRSIQVFFLVETLLLLFLASIVAFLLCININEILSEILKEIELPIIGRSEFGAYISNYLITFFIMAIIAALSVWYPAKKASDIQPVEALREE